MKRKLVTFIVLAVSTGSLLAGCSKTPESGEIADSGKETAIEISTEDKTDTAESGKITESNGEVAAEETPADETATGSSNTTEVYPGIAFATTDDGSIVNPDEVIDAIAAKMNSLSGPDESAFPEGIEIRNDLVNYDTAQSISDEEFNACVADDGLYVSKDNLKTVGDAQQLVPYLAYGKLTLSVIRQIANEYNIDLSNAEIHIDFLGGFDVVDSTTGEVIMEFTDYASVNGYRYYIASWNENGSRKQVGYAVVDIML